MQSLRTQLHPGVLPTPRNVRPRRQRGPHLMQGDLDGASGVCALWSALITLSFVTRAQAKSFRHQISHGVLQRLWLSGLDTYFAGSDDDQMLALVQVVGKRLCHERSIGPMRAQVEFVLRCLRAGGVVMLKLEQRAAAEDHWTLAVGWETLGVQGKERAIGILCLDSAEPGPSLLRFNCRLELDSPRFGATYVRYRRASGDACGMKIVSAIALTQSQPVSSVGRNGRIES